MKILASSVTILAMALAVVKAQVQVKIDATKYPKIDTPIDPKHPQVVEWMKEIDLTGVPNVSLARGPIDAAQNCTAEPGKDGDCVGTCQQCKGEDIQACGLAKTWGVTFDDGPSEITPSLLDFLKANKVQATFFLVGGNVIQRPDTVKRELEEGHHLASHTWSHSSLNKLTNEQIVGEIKWTEKAVFEAAGVRLKYIRPPFGDINARVRFIINKLGYKVVDWTGDEFDTTDWKIGDGYNEAQAVTHFSNSLNKYVAGPATKGFYCLEHDMKPAELSLAQKLIPLGQKHQLNFAHVGTCEGDASPYQSGSNIPPSGNNTNTGNNNTGKGNGTNPTVINNKNGTDPKSAADKLMGGMTIVALTAIAAAGALVA